MFEGGGAGLVVVRVRKSETKVQVEFKGKKDDEDDKNEDDEDDEDDGEDGGALEEYPVPDDNPPVHWPTRTMRQHHRGFGG